MTITAILRGFKVPIAILDRFLEANGVEPTFSYSPFYGPQPPNFFDSGPRDADVASKFLRSKLDEDGAKALIFIPRKMGWPRSKYAYVAYAWVMFVAQRKIDLATELPDRAPAGFAELRREILGFAEAGEEGLLQAEGLQGEEDDKLLTALYAIADEDRDSFPKAEPFLRKSDLRCDQCESTFEEWGQRQYHRRDAHGCELVSDVLPDF